MCNLQIHILQVRCTASISQSLPTDRLPPPPSWSAYMSSAASLDCASSFKPHPWNGTKQNTLHVVVFFFFFLHLPLYSSPDAAINIQQMRDKHCVWCFAVISHRGIFYRCRIVGARLAASSPINRRLIPHMSALPVSTCPQITAIHHCWTRRYTPLHKEFLLCVEAVNRGRCREGREAWERWKIWLFGNYRS